MKSAPARLTRGWVGLLLLLPIGMATDLRADTKAPAPAPRQIFVCTSSQASPALHQAADALTAAAADVPLLKALVDGQEASGAASHASEDFLAPKAYDIAAHNHLIVIGLRSQDALLDKVWGYDASVDEPQKTMYAQGWGYLQGDVGWIESDRNPFLHSHRIKSAPEDTVTVKITGTSEAGVLAALKAFRGGMLNGFVVAGPLARPKTTLLDLAPSVDPAPGIMPAQVKIGDATAEMAGWNQLPEEEYRAVLEAGGTEPKKMWRYKYLVPGMLEQKPIVRWLGGVNRMAFGNAIDVIQCNSPAEATAAALQISKVTCGASSFALEAAHITQNDLVFKPISLAGANAAWQCLQAPDEAMEATWKIIVTSAGSNVFLSSLPPEGTSAVIAAVGGLPAH